MHSYLSEKQTTAEFYMKSSQTLSFACSFSVKDKKISKSKVKGHMLLGRRLEGSNQYLCDIWLMQMISNCS